MKNTIRVRKDAATKAASLQTKTSRRQIQAENPSAPATAVFLIPSQVAKEAEVAIANLERVGNAAVAFVIMNGSLIQQCSQDCVGWEELAAPGFSKGSLELARIVSADFQSFFADWAGISRGLIEKIHDVHAPVEKNCRQKHLTIFAVIDQNRIWSRMASIVGALQHCIDLQNWAFSCYGGLDPQSGCFEMKRNLAAAEKATELAILNLMDCFCSVTATGQEVAS